MNKLKEIEEQRYDDNASGTTSIYIHQLEWLIQQAVDLFEGKNVYTLYISEDDLNLKLFNSFYYGKGEPLTEGQLMQLKDFFHRGIMQIDTQLGELKQLEEKSKNETNKP